MYIIVVIGLILMVMSLWWVASWRKNKGIGDKRTTAWLFFVFAGFTLLVTLGSIAHMGDIHRETDLYGRFIKTSSMPSAVPLMTVFWSFFAVMEGLILLRPGSKVIKFWRKFAEVGMLLSFCLLMLQIFSR